MSPRGGKAVADQTAPKARRSRPAREAKYEQLLELAAQAFNASGVAGASLTRIARDIGLTRAALYYYVEHRGDLVFQCYRRSCAVTAADLAAAAGEGTDGLSRLLAFVRRALDPDRAPTAVVSELDVLVGPHRREIAAALAANVESLRAILRSGAADKSLRACDDEVIAQTLIGVIAWIPLSVDWVEATDPTFRARTVETLVDLILNGQAADPAYRFVSPVSIEAFRSPPPRAFDRAAQADAKLDELLKAASEQFNRRGIDGVSLDDITASLGATKGAFYHYLDNKTDLVVRCYRRAFDLYERFVEAAERAGRTGLERGLIGHYLNVQAHAAGLAPLIQMVGPTALPAKARREVQRRARSLQQRFEGFAQAGLADGSHRPMDFYALAQLGAGSFEWLPKWFDPADARAPQALAEQILDLFVHGLRPRQNTMRTI